ncbi:hypothetical protein MUTS15_43280 [Escherichia coli]|nr:hypothetical protein MUTS15_43280 [Escherichia coli]
MPAYAGLTSITAGYDFTDYSGEHGNRNLAYAELVAKVENATLLLIFPRGVVIMKLNISMPLAARVQSGTNGITG